MHKENAALWKVKHLQTKLIGDHNWVPCEMMVGPNDIEFYDDDYSAHPQDSVKSEGSVMLDYTRDANKANGHSIANGLRRSPNNPNIGEKADTSIVDGNTPAHDAGEAQGSGTNGKQASDQAEQAVNVSDPKLQANGLAVDVDAPQNKTKGSSVANGTITNGSAGPNGPDTTNTQVANIHIDATRLANENSRPMSLVSDSSNELPIHPMFIAPRSARPDRDLGIPESEAEDMRRLLQLYVQKQEEVCRGVKRLYEGLLRADRMRKTVFKWSKYEAHVGPNRDMSDGEDWYDKEEWGLEEDLKKGQDEEEDEVPQTTKKTRTRR
jgi:hypothetical protein